MSGRSLLAALLGALLCAPSVGTAAPSYGAVGAAPAPPLQGAPSSAFAIPEGSKQDPYGPRPRHVPHLTQAQILRFALDNPAIEAAEQRVEAMRAQVRKANFAWVPLIETRMMLMPGVNIECDDVQLLRAEPDAMGQREFDFQYCRPGGDEDLDVQSLSDYLSQLNTAGIRFTFDVDVLFPLSTFGKGLAVREMAKTGVALAKLGREQIRAETTLRVLQAHATLLLARETMTILREAKQVVDQAVDRISSDLGDPDDFAADLSEGSLERDPDDLIRARLADVTVETSMREARKIEALALAALWALAGEAAPPGFDIQETRLERYPVEGGLQSMQYYKDLARRNRPEAKLATGMVHLRKAQQKLARRNFLPDLGFVLGVDVGRSTAVDTDMQRLYYRDRFNYGGITAALALRWRWDFHNKAFDLQIATAEFRQAELQRQAALLLLGRDVEEAYQTLVEARHNFEQYRLATDLSWRLVVSQEQRDTIGGGNAQDLIRALKDWYEWRFKAAEAVQAYNVALAKLSRAVGTSLLAPQDR